MTEMTNGIKVVGFLILKTTEKPRMGFSGIGTEAPEVFGQCALGGCPGRF